MFNIEKISEQKRNHKAAYLIQPPPSNIDARPFNGHCLGFKDFRDTYYHLGHICIDDAKIAKLQAIIEETSERRKLGDEQSNSKRAKIGEIDTSRGFGGGLLNAFSSLAGWLGSSTLGWEAFLWKQLTML
ncbi:predicted protein [Sclerotinia sclerotiorum 1980 UF-70]|uniref:Uncharacterized protein n=1 Tax=Sclerotinia sclerotiorum (strain ATCC 18683 / 1980 / Ss-1) TaxID=665079 RepID=A7ESY9_SCLS1|nr:predicted protein [Sclerotinia sclerotiorum 1980 UF-70]EDN92581.1 predicted protein [Sclerotinia sclerotiorum 1980 UF-70]